MKYENILSKIHLHKIFYTTFDNMYHSQEQKVYVYSVTAGQTIYANKPPYFIGSPLATPIAVRSQTLEYGPEINKLQEGVQ